MRTLITLAIIAIATTAHADWVITLDLEAETTVIVDYPEPPITIPSVEDDHRLGARGPITLSDDLSMIIGVGFDLIHTTSRYSGAGRWEIDHLPRDLGGLGFALSGDEVFILPGSPGGTTFSTPGDSRMNFYLNGDGPKFDLVHPFGTVGNTYPFYEYTEPFPLTPYGYRLGTIEHVSTCVPESSPLAGLLLFCLHGYGRRTRTMGA